MDVDVVVVVVVDTDVILQMTRTYSAIMLYLKMERVVNPLKGVVMVVLDLTVVVAVVVSVMGKMQMGSDLAGCMNAVVGQGAEMSSNVKALVVVIGELKLMNLLR
ncbi:hypothetical protein Golob_013429 [Gossypium lobatum]|uniref:Transmembrane protein n=1 Tax=Gossypium lobatum TaxID=34289 RepID=A0A7J8LPF0_9ROSI|nr:hypothetical protein [Gossypium lobatum]